MKKWVELSAAIVTIIVTIIAITNQIQSTKQNNEMRYKETIIYKTENQQQETVSNKSQHIAKFDKLIDGDKQITNANQINSKINDLEAKISKINSQTLALRQAINPVKPDEILTIARLTDQVKSLADAHKDLDKAVRAEQEAFKASIIRELKSTHEANNIMLVVIVPLVLNFLYTVWKDLKEKKDSVVQLTNKSADV